MGATSVVGNLDDNLAGFFKGNAEILISAATVLNVGHLDHMLVCSGTTADYSVYLPKPADCAGHYIGFRMDPGLTKLVTVDAGQSDNAKPGYVTTRADAEITTGHVNRTESNYDGYEFSSVSDGISASNFHVGDRLVWSWDNSTNRVSYTTATSPVTIADKLANGLYNFGFVRSLKSTGIVGLNTSFLTDLTLNAEMWVNGESRIVKWIGDNTHCGVESPFSVAGSGLTYSAAGTPYTIDGQQTRIMWANEVAILYSDGYKWTKVAGKAIPMTASYRLNGNQTAAAGALTCIAWDYTIAEHTNCPAVMTASRPKFFAPRPGVYHVDVTIQINDDNASASYNLVNLQVYPVTGTAMTWLWHYEQTKTANTRVVRQLSTNLKVVNAGDLIQACFRYDSGSSAKCLQGYTEQTYFSNNFAITEQPTW